MILENDNDLMINYNDKSKMIMDLRILNNQSLEFTTFT